MAEDNVKLHNMEKALMDKMGQHDVREPNLFERLFQPCVAELVGTAFFVFIGCVSVIENVADAGRLQPALAHGLAVAVLIACMAEISGSHFNPSFTIAVYLCGGMELKMVAPYLISQLTGGLLGAVMANGMTSNEKYARAQGAAFTVLQADDHVLKPLFGEIAMTCLVTMVVLLGAVNAKSKSPLVPFLVGCTVIINVLAGGDVSGTCLNPARALGPAVLTNYWTHHWVYWVGPITGGLIAAALVRILLGDNNTRLLMK
ncbi:aquaporin-8b [Sinocyclocheilus rhinocerous]|uniref:Aquaporin-4 n=1 Tax=Sinocyclocheilus rhinocerous TaxID=307959 RepID=A0A673MID6_9TELE|nr:PREDICTED: aquaporin-8-like [Sinocyclocheilus rhinocerous]